MPTPALCSHCGHAVALPDGWAAPGFTCPACRGVTPVAAPAPPDPFALDPADFGPARPRPRPATTPTLGGSFAAGFGGCFGVAAAALVMMSAAAVFWVAVCAGGCGLLLDQTPREPPAARR